MVAHSNYIITAYIRTNVKIIDSRLHFLLSLYFIFIFIFRTTQVRVYQSYCYTSHKVDGIVTRLITGLERIE